MKRVNGLFEKIIDFKNLHTACGKALKGSPHSLEAQRFIFHKEKELFSLQCNLLEKRYKPGPFKHYKIYDPKERLISVAPFRDRVVHHAIVSVLEPVYEPVFIYDSYATRKNKGTHAAILRVQKFMRHVEFYLKTDIQKHFENIDHDVLLWILARKVKDRKCMELIETVIKGVPWDKGLPIGNLTSQFFANVYLDLLDHYIKEELQFKYYVRYMDDMVFLSGSRDELKRVRDLSEQFLAEQLKLRYKPKAVYINRRLNGISFLGARIFPHHLRIKPGCFRRTLKGLEQKTMEYKIGTIDESSYTASLCSVMGHLDFFNSYRLRYKTGQANNWF